MSCTRACPLPGRSVSSSTSLRRSESSGTAFSSRYSTRRFAVARSDALSPPPLTPALLKITSVASTVCTSAPVSIFSRTSCSRSTSAALSHSSTVSVFAVRS